MRTNRFYAVIHARDLLQVERNLDVALGNGADGAFLINHEISPEQLLGVYASARRDRPLAYIGLNLLGVTQVQAIKLVPLDASALWIDDGGIWPKAENGYRTEMAALIRQQIEVRGFRGEYYGGVAFKGQRFSFRNYELIARKALGLIEIPTTSGARTGEPPTLEKIKAMRKGLGDGTPFANASGMTPENVEPYLDYVDRFLVATGISSDPWTLRSGLVRAFADKMRR